MALLSVNLVKLLLYGGAIFTSKKGFNLTMQTRPRFWGRQHGQLPGARGLRGAPRGAPLYTRYNRPEELRAPGSCFARGADVRLISRSGPDADQYINSEFRVAK